MARREIKMEELIEVLSQWHAGRSISQIKRSVGIARKTVRKYFNLAEGCGFSRDSEMQPYLYYLTFAGRVQPHTRRPLYTRSFGGNTEKG